MNKDLFSMTAKDIMQPDVVTVAESSPLSEVERLLSENRIGGVPVTNETGHIVGVISIRDLVERYTQDPDSRPRRGHGFYHLSSHELLEDDWDSFEVPAEAEETAGQVMTAEIYSVAPDTPITSIAERMVELGIHRVMVQKGTKVVGLVTTTDILRAVAGK